MATRTRRQPPRLSYLVKQLELAIRSEMDLQTRAHGLTTMQYTALTVLQRHPGMSGAELSRRSFVSPQGGNQMVAQLERRGWIERLPDPQNRRILRMSLTKDGEQIVRACEGWMDDLERRMLKGIPKGDSSDFGRYLQMCVHNLKA